MALLLRLLVPFALAGAGAFYFVQAGAIRSLYSTGPIGPDAVPKLFVAALALALVFVIVAEVRAARGDGASMDAGGALAVVLVVAACAGYVAIFRLAGFFASTGVFAFALLAIFARGPFSIVMALLQAAAITILVYVLFAILFDVRLPTTPAVGALFGNAAPAPAPADVPASPADATR